jgi:hypothetical protein
MTGAEERRATRRLEVQDRRADVLPRQTECLLGLRPHRSIESAVSQRVEQVEGQSERRQERFEHRACALQHRVERAFGAGSFEDACPQRLVQLADLLGPVVGAHLRRHPQELEPRVVHGRVLGREVRVVVDVLVDDPQ